MSYEYVSNRPVCHLFSCHLFSVPLVRTRAPASPTMCRFIPALSDHKSSDHKSSALRRLGNASSPLEALRRQPE